MVQDGLAEAYAIPAASVRRAAMLLGSTPTAAATLLAQDGAGALDAVTLRVGQPVRPMLAASAADITAALDKSGLPASSTARSTGSACRSTEMARQLVLDAEALALRPDGRPHPFQVIASRTASRVDVDVDAMRRQTPLSLFCLDVLHIDGRGLLDEPLRRRIELMAQVLPPELIVSRAVAVRRRMGPWSPHGQAVQPASRSPRLRPAIPVASPCGSRG